MSRHVHFVGSIGLDTAEEVLTTVGKTVGDHILRCPDGEVGGRRLWISWQYPLLRSSPYLQMTADKVIPGAGLSPLHVAPDVSPHEIHFGELGYAREAWASYQDFVAARDRGDLPKHVRFQVSLPTPFAVIGAFVEQQDVPKVLPAYTEAMVREVRSLCDRIPHDDLAIQWDVCIEMIMWDGRFPAIPPFPEMEAVFRQAFRTLSAPVPPDVELGIHLCYGDMDAAHFIDPLDTRKAVELGNLINEEMPHPLAWIHLPVPANRDDVAYFDPLRDLKRDGGTELFLGLVHAADGHEGARRRIAAASQVIKEFGIATECGIARARTVQAVKDLLKTHAAVAEL